MPKSRFDMTYRKQPRIRRGARLVSLACQATGSQAHSSVARMHACMQRGHHEDVVINLVLAEERGSKVREPRVPGQLLKRLALQRVVRLQMRACVRACVSECVYTQRVHECMQI